MLEKIKKALDENLKDKEVVRWPEYQIKNVVNDVFTKEGEITVLNQMTAKKVGKENTIYVRYKGETLLYVSYRRKTNPKYTPYGANSYMFKQYLFDRFFVTVCSSRSEEITIKQRIAEIDVMVDRQKEMKKTKFSEALKAFIILQETFPDKSEWDIREIAKTIDREYYDLKSAINLAKQGE